MKKLFAVLLMVLAVLTVSFGCNGGNDVTGPGDGDKTQPAPTPNPDGHQQRPCGGPKSNPLDC